MRDSIVKYSADHANLIFHSEGFAKMMGDVAESSKELAQELGKSLTAANPGGKWETCCFCGSIVSYQIPQDPGRHDISVTRRYGTGLVDMLQTLGLGLTHVGVLCRRKVRSRLRRAPNPTSL